MLNKFVCPVKGNSQIFIGQDFKVKFWNWGLITIWHNMESVAFFSKSLHPIYCTLDSKYTYYTAFLLYINYSLC